MSNIKIIAMSDTHGDLPVISDADILLHCGDICPCIAGPKGWGVEVLYQKQWVEDRLLPWINSLDVKNIILCPGNHDIYFQDSGIDSVGKAKIISNDTITVDGIKIYCNSITPWFWGWAFNGPQDAMEAEKFFYSHWDNIEPDTDIVVTHGPPHGILDYADSQHLGEFYLRQKINEIRPKYHLFGHIHEDGGKEYTDNSTVFLNLARHIKVISYEAQTGSWSHSSVSR